MARASDSPAAPRVSPPDLPPRLDPATPSRGVDLLQASLTLSGTVDLAHATLEQCTLSADADALDLTGATVLDVLATEVRAAVVTLRDASIRRLRIVGARIGTLDLSGTRIDELEIRDARIDYVTLGGAKATDVVFADTSVRTLDLPAAEVTRMVFDACRTDEVDTRGLRAKDLDLRGLDAASFTDAAGLRGAVLTTHQVQQLAPTMAAGLGIRTLD